MALSAPGDRAQEELVQYCRDLLTKHKDNHEMRNKMAVIDRAYARYKQLTTEACANGEGVDEQIVQHQIADELGELKDSFIHVEIPLVVSQVDTFVGYAAEIYLSGYPMFGIVADPKDKKVGQYMEALLDKHSRIGGYGRELQMFLQDCGKYNFAPLYVDWDTVTHYERTSQEDVTINDQALLNKVDIGYTSIRRLDPYNTFVDESVLSGSASRDGDYAGFVELLTMPQLRRLLTKLAAAGRGEVLNSNVAMRSQHPSDKAYTQAPQVSQYTAPPEEFDWDKYVSSTRSDKNDVSYGSKFEVTTITFKAEPKDFKLKDDAGEHIYKIIVVNQEYVVYIERVYTPFSTLPILVGQPKEDGLNLQTQSIAEAAIPMQAAASGLVNMRFHSARRAIADRALYDEDAIDADDANNPSASAKIAVKTNSLSQKRLSDFYHSIPYHDTASNGMLSDALTVSDWTSDLTGQNRASQGNFTKGNRTQGEFSEIQSNAEQRQRLPILTLESQVFMPLKNMLLLNIMRFGSEEIVQAQDTGEQLTADINTLTNTVLDFKVSDGYLPKSKLANTDFLSAMMAQIGQNPLLAQSYGQHLPAMFAHMAALAGIPGLEQFVPEQQQTAPPTTDEGDPNAQQPNTTAT